MRDPTTIATIRGATRIWVVGAIHGEVERLRALHSQLEGRFERREALIYAGNYLGHGTGIVDTVTELLTFRRRMLARPPLRTPDEIVFLRGSQEEMWQKLLQLQFAGDPVAVLNWMLARGVESTLKAYAGVDGCKNASAGTVALNNWTRQLRAQMRQHPGHETFMSALKRAAVTDDGKILVVNSGIDPGRPLTGQSDSFWWGARGFDRIAEPYEGFRRIVRGYDPAHGGVKETDYTLSVDGGCGFGGTLVAACLGPDGTMIERIEA